ncbi:unnamed protein product [Hyaloperonospora brassicae]|uniref:RxLR effector candidate protein n=1 Tax=Hyaloperonospora brassicae TaxID=162125 RepID=A0AAV0V222_HYABA|nr:unnamed protein product [Hyaloperonospora brassicae]
MTKGFHLLALALILLAFRDARSVPLAGMLADMTTPNPNLPTQLETDHSRMLRETGDPVEEAAEQRGPSGVKNEQALAHLGETLLSEQKIRDPSTVTTEEVSDYLHKVLSLKQKTRDPSTVTTEEVSAYLHKVLFPKQANGIVVDGKGAPHANAMDPASRKWESQPVPKP